jgi:hypothetical protein
MRESFGEWDSYVKLRDQARFGACSERDRLDRFMTLNHTKT